jgi:hypothetical protein
MELKNMETGETRDGYAAVNLYGCVDAVDLEASPHRLRFGAPHFTGKVLIDPVKVGDWQAFRLPYGESLIVVTQRIADALRPQKLASVLFQPTTAYKGV